MKIGDNIIGINAVIEVGIASVNQKKPWLMSYLIQF